MLYDFIQLNRRGKGPLWQQLYTQLLGAIAAGKLQPGEKLPSIREACRELSLSRTTVETAYGRLCMELWAESRPQSGYRIRSLLPRPQAAPAPRPPRPRYDFSTSAMDPRAADLLNWKKLVRAVLSDSSVVASYGDPQGEPFLREQLASYAFRSRGVLTEPDCIFIGAGVGPLLQLLCPLFPEKPPVYLQSPGFPQAEQIFKDYGFSVSVPPTLEAASALPAQPCAIAAELPSLHPKVHSAAYSLRKSELKAWAEGKEGRWILEDDYNGELRCRTRPLPSFQGSIPEKTIYLGSFSKLLLPSVRMAYMVLPPVLAEKARDRLGVLNQTAGKTEQLALAEYIRTGLLEKHLRRLRRLHMKKSSAMQSALQKAFGDRAEATLFESHLALVLTLHTEADSGELCALAKQAGISLRAAPGYGGPEPRITLGFSGIGEEDIGPGIEALKNAWSSVFS